MTAAAVAARKAVQDWYAAEGIAPAPLWADKLPAVSGASGSTTPPDAAAMIRAEAVSTQKRAGVPPLETIRLTLVGYFPTAAAADAWSQAVAYGGEPVASLAGLDGGRLPPLPNGWAFDSCKPQRPPDIAEDAKRGHDGRPAHRCQMTYLLTFRRS